MTGGGRPSKDWQCCRFAVGRLVQAVGQALWGLKTWRLLHVLLEGDARAATSAMNPRSIPGIHASLPQACYFVWENISPWAFLPLCQNW